MFTWISVMLNGVGRVIRSIRFRITLWAVGILALVLIAFSAVIYVGQENTMYESAYQRLRGHSRQMMIAYQLALQGWDGQGGQSLPGPAILAGGGWNPQDGDVLVLASQDGNALQTFGAADKTEIKNIASSLHKENISPADVLLTHVHSAPWYDIAHVGNLYLVASVQQLGNQSSYLLMVGSPIDPTGILPKLLANLALASLGILLVALLGGYWLASRLLAPVRKITRTAQDINDSDLSRRIHLGSQDELGELASTFDQMLDRLQGAFDRQRQFTADASHELRTPLTIVDLEASRALDHRRSTEEYERALRVIHSENSFMTRLVNNLLTLARLDAGRATLKMEPVDLSELAVEVVERLEALAHEKKVEIVAGDLPEVPVLGDRQYLIQMLNNLVENAIKYSKPEGGRICVETGVRTDGPAPAGWVQVEDNGQGIPDDALPHIFDRFYRVDAVRSHNPDDGVESGEMEGSGLGLAIVDWIVRAHDGHIRITSQVGGGSVFEVEIPLAQPPL